MFPATMMMTKASGVRKTVSDNNLLNSSALQCRLAGKYPRYGLMSALSLSAKSANICIVDSEILKLASSPSTERKRSSLDSVGSNTSLS